jgi:hypothetical protein
MPSNQPLDRPPIDALFLIHFDVKAGYTILWKQNAPGIDLEGLVEYKSLPSGLHTVSKDLIYFVNDSVHAGLSAFVNMPCDEEEARNARMFAVGVLVPLSYGRLGRAWRHAEGLKEMAAYASILPICNAFGVETWIWLTSCLGNLQRIAKTRVYLKSIGLPIAKRRAMAIVVFQERRP